MRSSMNMQLIRQRKVLRTLLDLQKFVNHFIELKYHKEKGLKFYNKIEQFKKTNTMQDNS